MLKISCALLLVFAAAPAVALAADTAYVHGRVVSANNGAPLAGVDVTYKSPGGESHVMTDSNGVYEFWGAPFGKAVLSFAHDGFMESAGVVCVKGDAMDMPTIKLFNGGTRDDARAEFGQWQVLDRSIVLETTTDATWIGPC